MSRPSAGRAAPLLASSVPFALLLPVLLLLASCGTLHDWQEVKTEKIAQAELFDAIEHIALKNGYTPDVGETDRGLGVFVSRWRRSHQWVGRPLRYRLVVEVDLEEPTQEGGYFVRYAVERQKVGNPSRSMDPREEDWSDDGQESEAEYLFGTSLQLRLTGKVEGMQIAPVERNRG